MCEGPADEGVGESPKGSCSGFGLISSAALEAA